MPRTGLRIPREMAKAIVRYDAEATKILQAFINAVEAKKPPPVLYHYTNDAGLAGIIESGSYGFRTSSRSTILPNCDTGSVLQSAW